MKKENWKLVNLNNKNRKGTYIYIQGRYYKYHGKRGEIEATIQYHKDNKRKNKKGTRGSYIRKYKKEEKQGIKYLKKIKKKGTIEQNIKKGIGKATITNISRTGNTQKKQALRKLLKNLVIDKEIREIMILPENINKLKHRMEYKITFYNDEAEPLLRSSKMNTTIENVLQDTQWVEQQRERIDNTSPQKVTEQLKRTGWKNIQLTKEGNCTHTKLEIKFMKGK